MKFRRSSTSRRKQSFRGSDGGYDGFPTTAADVEAADRTGDYAMMGFGGGSSPQIPWGCNRRSARPRRLRSDSRRYGDSPYDAVMGCEDCSWSPGGPAEPVAAYALSESSSSSDDDDNCRGAGMVEHEPFVGEPFELRRRSAISRRGSVSRRRSRLCSSTKAQPRLSARRIAARVTDKAAYKAYFRLIAEDPSEELAVVKDLTAPLIRSSPVTLPFDLSQAVADNCLSLSGMGYNLGVGSCCPTCNGRDEPRLGRLDRAALTLAYVQQVNDIYHYRAFMASVVALADREDQRRHEGDCPPDGRCEGGFERQGALAVLTKALARPELFFAYHVLRDGGVGDARVLFYPDHEASGDYMMYVVFPGKSVHLHHRLLDCLQAACRGYRLIAHVWQTAFLLVVRRESERQTDTDRVPRVNAEDVYCKLCDLNIDGELLLEYAKLYAAFDDFLPPR